MCHVPSMIHLMPSEQKGDRAQDTHVVVLDD
jgi:hypothetical protein